MPVPSDGPRRVNSGSRVAAWALITMATLLLATLIGIELALAWPGMLVPFGVLVVLVGGGLAATMRAHWALIRDPRAGGAVAAGDVILGASAALAAGVLLVLGALLLAFVCVLVLFYMLCGGELLRLG